MSFRRWIAAGVVGILLSPGGLAAQDRVVLPPGWHVGHVRVEGGAPADRARTASSRLRQADRGLTVRKGFTRPDFADDSDPFEFGTSRYGDIRTFNPFPTVTSGTQLPFGLDGIGGFGSDVGFSAGADAALYDRGG